MLRFRLEPLRHAAQRVSVRHGGFVAIQHVRAEMFEGGAPAELLLEAHLYAQVGRIAAVAGATSGGAISIASVCENRTSTFGVSIQQFVDLPLALGRNSGAGHQHLAIGQIDFHRIAQVGPNSVQGEITCSSSEIEAEDLGASAAGRLGTTGRKGAS